MTILKTIFTFFIFICCAQEMLGYAEDDIAEILLELNDEIHEVEKIYHVQHELLASKLRHVRIHLKKDQDLRSQVELLILKDQLEAELKKSLSLKFSDISKIRYLKGLQIIKILYEKTLALDHHFSSVTTLNEINRISNPNNYTEFLGVKEHLKTNHDKKNGFNLSAILGENIYTSVIHSFVSLFTNEKASKQEKETSLKEIECILDFTLQMHNDLNTIYFETAFLQKSNENIMSELFQLFTDFTKPIQYKTDLKTCRDTDDWDTVRANLNEYLEELNGALKDDAKSKKAHKMQINIVFPIDRLLQFINQYNAFIDQGAKFYEKFAIMLTSYENERVCANKIPGEYHKLKENVSISIDKFNSAYRPVEINGSKMKEVLYGINEYN